MRGLKGHEKGLYVYQLPHFDPDQKAFKAFKERVAQQVDNNSEDLMNLINHRAYGSHGKWNLTMRFEEAGDGEIDTEHQHGPHSGWGRQGFAALQREHGLIIDDIRFLIGPGVDGVGIRLMRSTILGAMSWGSLTDYPSGLPAGQSTEHEVSQPGERAFYRIDFYPIVVPNGD